MSRLSGKAANSSNSQRLREVAEREGCATQLVSDERGVDWSALANARSVAVTAGASAPEALVERVLEALHARYDVELETLTTTNESMIFPPPRELREPAQQTPRYLSASVRS